jgi:hypothetical protein
VSLHARPRTTKDLDLWVDARAENVGRACAALAAFGAPAQIIDDLRGAAPGEEEVSCPPETAPPPDLLGVGTDGSRSLR